MIFGKSKQAIEKELNHSLDRIGISREDLDQLFIAIGNKVEVLDDATITATMDKLPSIPTTLLALSSDTSLLAISTGLMYDLGPFLKKSVFRPSVQTMIAIGNAALQGQFR